MELLNLKAIPIAHAKKVYSISQKELTVIKKAEYRPPQEGHYLSQSISLLNHKTLTPLRKFILKKAKEYTRKILGIKEEIYMTQSWSTINTTNAFHKPHSHPNTFISVVYYAQCQDGFLFFDLHTSSLREGFNFQYTINHFNIYNSAIWDLPVQTGDMVLFPGHIDHGSTPNKSTEPRIIIGANFFIKGKLGSKKFVDLIGVQPLELKN